MDHDFSIEQLKLAFSFHISNQILESDGIVMPAEAEFLTGMFPQGAFLESGFVDEAGSYTPRWQDALGEALLELPVQLSVDERLTMLQTFYEAALADGEVRYIEGTVLVRAARLLGLKPSQFTARLEAMIGAESIELPSPESE